MSLFSRLFPWGVVALGAIWILTAMQPAEDEAGAMHLREFGTLPVVDGGRVKPIDSVARNTMFIISNRQQFTDDKKKYHPAIEWLLEALTASELFRDPEKGVPAEKLKVFRIENDQVLSLFQLEPRPEFMRYSLEELRPHYKEFIERVNLADDRKPQDRDLVDHKLLDLYRHMQLYQTLVMIQTPELAKMQMAAEAQGRPKLETPLTIPPSTANADWHTFGKALVAMREEGKDDPGAKAFGRILLAYSQGNIKDFNDSVEAYKKFVAEVVPANELEKARFEAWFNNFAPFDLCSWLYVCVFLLAAMSWIGWTEPLRQAAFGLGFLTWVVHTGAILGRMYIQSRPPITNLYSTAVFIGWGCVLTGLILEWLYRNGLGVSVAALCGGLTLRLAGVLAENQPDTLEMLQAVLDTNFWLATHVTSINVGYIATFVAGTIGCAFILRGLLTEVISRITGDVYVLGDSVKGRGFFNFILRGAMTPDEIRKMGQMLYGVVCFAMFFSFVGTVLGGIWGDYSWGRFWGWDPKENGAVMIVIWNALILHARWGGLVKVRGMAVLAVFGNMVTAWSYFGTNQLGVGLHAYGFSKELADGLRFFWLTQLPIILIGLLPLRAWRGWTPPGVDLGPKSTDRLPTPRAQAAAIASR